MSLPVTLPWVFRELGEGVLNPDGAIGPPPSEPSGGIPDVIIGSNTTHLLDIYDILCDGSNDQTDLLNAVNLLGPQGGWIHFLQGQYNFQGPVVVAADEGQSIRITGAGRQITTIRVAANLGSNNLISLTQGGASSSGKIEIADLTITGLFGSPTPSVSGSLIHIVGSTVLTTWFNRVDVVDGHANGIEINRSSGNHYFNSVRSLRHGQAGMKEYECNSYHSDCVYSSNGSYGSLGNYGGQRAFVRCAFTSNGNDGIANSGLTSGGSYTVVACQIDGNGDHGVNLDLDASNDSPVIVVGNFIRNNSNSAVRTDDNAVVGLNFISGNGNNIPSTGIGTNVIGGVQPVPDLPQSMVFSYGGDLVIGTGTFKWVPNRSGRIVSVRAAVGTAPTGDDIVVDVNLDGASIFLNPADQPEIPATTQVGPAVSPPTTPFVAGDYVTVDIDQIGTTIPGADLTVMVEIVIDDVLD